MKKWAGVIGVIGVLFVSGAANPVGAANIILPRAGHVGFGGQGQYGTFLKSGSLGEDFGGGAGFTVRLRYRMRFERAVGLSFERQGFEIRDASAADTAAARMTMVTAGAEIYQMFGTRTRTTKMVSVGAGLAQISKKLNNDETEFVNDGVYVSLGAGIEHFFWGSWAYDVSSRYMLVFQDAKTNHDFQLSFGLIFYASQ